MRNWGLLVLLCLGCNRQADQSNEKVEKKQHGRCEVCPQGAVALPSGAGGAFGVVSPASIADNCDQTQCQ